MVGVAMSARFIDHPPLTCQEKADANHADRHRESRHAPHADGSLPCRLWTGQTESGILVDAYIASIEPQDIANARRLEDELLETTRES